MKLLLKVVLLFWMSLLPLSAFAKTWYVRPDGGTRYSANMPTGQCDGGSDVAYGGSGVNRHCAFREFRSLWDDKSGKVGRGAWVIAGGDTVIVRGCTADSTQSNAADPDCRIGWDAPTGTGANLWCYAVGSYDCMNPPIPAGSPGAHTRILGQNYASCSTSGQSDPRAYAARLTHLFGGFSLNNTFNLQDTAYVDIECIELTTHNGQCVRGGSPAYPRPCRSDQPLDDYAQNGFLLNKNSSNISFQDVYVHGFNGSGLQGPIGGPIRMSKVFVGFNGFSGWNFDDGRNTPDAPGASIHARDVTMIGNGCYEEYPLKHAFSAQACYDDESGGFGDAWSGQDTDLDTFFCEHCVMAYNTKDAFIGPHTNVRHLLISNSESFGNMGAQWKWNNTPNSETIFRNNVTIGNCARFAENIPGAAHSFAKSSHEPGAYLSDFCRAGGNTVAINSQQNSHVLFAGNTFVNYLNTGFLLSCGPSTANRNKMCGATTFHFVDNIFLGFKVKGSEAPAIFYVDDPSIHITMHHNIDFGNRDACKAGNLCVDPKLLRQPAQRVWDTQTFLDGFDFEPRSDSPAISRGVAVDGLAVDFFGSSRGKAPTIGAVEPSHKASR